MERLAEYTGLNNTGSLSDGKNESRKSRIGIRLIETMATSVGNICNVEQTRQSTLDLEYQDSAGGFENFILYA